MEEFVFIGCYDELMQQKHGYGHGRKAVGTVEQCMHG